MKNTFERNSLPKVLLDKGYQVDALEEDHPYFLYPKAFSNWSSKRPPEDLSNQVYILKNITLFRHSPHFIKKWLIGKRFSVKPRSHKTRHNKDLLGNAIFQDNGRKCSIRNSHGCRPSGDRTSIQ